MWFKSHSKANYLFLHLLHTHCDCAAINNPFHLIWRREASHQKVCSSVLAYLFTSYCCCGSRYRKHYRLIFSEVAKGTCQVFTKCKALLSTILLIGAWFRLHSLLLRFFGPTNRVVTLKLIRYSLIMVLAPLTAFYLSFYVLFKQDKSKLMWCGFLAVFVVNVVIVSYVVMAWNEPDDRKKSNGLLKSKGAPGNSAAISLPKTD